MSPSKRKRARRAELDSAEKDRDSYKRLYEESEDMVLRCEKALLEIQRLAVVRPRSVGKVAADMLEAITVYLCPF